MSIGPLAYVCNSGTAWPQQSVHGTFNSWHESLQLGLKGRSSYSMMRVASGLWLEVTLCNEATERKPCCWYSYLGNLKSHCHLQGCCITTSMILLAISSLLGLLCSTSIYPCRIQNTPAGISRLDMTVPLMRSQIPTR